MMEKEAAIFTENRNMELNDWKEANMFTGN
jgi:hypothetical protein